MSLTVALVVLVGINLFLGVNSTPVNLRSNMGSSMNQVDLCILTCDACYKGEALLLCANACITEGRMAMKWGSTCHYFSNGRK